MITCACSRPIADGAAVCAHCGYELDSALQDVADWLAAELDVTLARLSATQARDGGRSATTPLPYDTRASRAAATLRTHLCGWVRVVAEGTRADWPADDIAAMAAWLRPWVGWIRHHEAGAEAVADIGRAVDAAYRVVDRHPDLLYAGPCEACGADLYGRLGAAYVRCRTPGCGQSYEVAARRSWLLDAARDHLATPKEISRALARYGEWDVSDSAVRGMAHAGRIVAGGRDERGRALYRVGDVIDVLLKRDERKEVSA